MKTDEQKLNIVGAAAQLLLENGSETYRVEETARRMARGFGMEQVNIAAFPTSVFLEADGRACVRRISRRGTNSRRIAMVNEISREVEHGKLSAEQAERGFCADAADARERKEELLFLLCCEAEEFHRVFADGKVGIAAHFLAHRRRFL